MSTRRRVVVYLGLAFVVALIVLLIVDAGRKGVFDEELGMNVAVVGERGVSLLLLRPQEDMVGWVEVPEDVRVKIYNSTASYPVGSLWEYGLSVKDGYRVIQRSLGRSMGVILAKTIKLEKGQQIEDVLREILYPGLKTNLGIKDRFLLRKYLSGAVASKKMLEYSLPETVFQRVEEADGKVVRDFNSTVDLWVKNKFVLDAILSESVEMSVVNTAETTGLGIALSRQLESAGVRVTEVVGEKVAGLTEGCHYAGGEKKMVTVKLLEEQLGCTAVGINRPKNEKEIRLYVNQ